MSTLLLRAFALCAFASIAGMAQATCDTGLAERLHAKLHPEKPLNHALTVCEPWRGKLNFSIVVLPLSLGDNNQWRDPDLEILVVQQPDNGNSERSTVVSRILEPGGPLDEETGPITEIRVDPAHYRLGPNEVAFGLRVMRRVDSTANPSSSETLALYMPKKAELVKLLDELEIAFEYGKNGSECDAQTLTRRGQLSVAPSKSHGLADLTLQYTQWSSRGIAQDDQCLAQPPRATYKTVTLRFDGERYRPPKRREN